MEKLFEEMFSKEFIEESKKNLKDLRKETFQRIKGLGVFNEGWLRKAMNVENEVEEKPIHPDKNTPANTPVKFTGNSAILKREQVYSIEKVENVPANPETLVSLNEVHGKFSSKDFEII